MSLQAHTDSLELLADQSLQILSVNDEIHIQAKDRIELLAADSAITLSGGDIEIRTPGTFEVKTSTHEFLGGGRGAAALPSLPQASSNPVLEGAMAAPATTAPTLGVKSKVNPLQYYEQFRALDETTGKPVVGMPYRIELSSGSVIKGKTDTEGRTRRVRTEDAQGAKLYWLPVAPVAHVRSDDGADAC